MPYIDGDGVVLDYGQRSQKEKHDSPPALFSMDSMGLLVGAKRIYTTLRIHGSLSALSRSMQPSVSGVPGREASEGTHTRETRYRRYQLPGRAAGVICF